MTKAAWIAAGLLASAAPAVAADPPGVRATARPNAVVGGGRAVGAEEVERAGRAVDGAPATTIFQSRLPDGSFELSDRAPAAGATPLGQRTYALPPQSASAQRAQAERDYWRRQAEAFERRQRERDRLTALEADRRDAVRAPQTVVLDSRYAVRGWGPAVPLRPPLPRPAPVDYGLGLQPAPLPGPQGSNGGSAYTSSPGAVQGRPTGGFIGSGFATGR
jgi:hypothetical protein